VTRSAAGTRTRNPRGSGTRLRAEILAAATTLLEESGTTEAVTLRAIARRVGISAPSIYAHFPDRDAVLDQVLQGAFTQLYAAIHADIDGIADPVERLRRGCQAYLRFAHERPQPYRIMFQRVDPRPAEVRPESDSTDGLIGGDAFQILVDAIAACARAGRSTSTDPYTDAVAVWIAMHGYALLRAGLPEFPWPPDDETFDRIVLRQAGVTA
jgi:AcrR family transcriptional regulator